MSEAAGKKELTGLPAGKPFYSRVAVSESDGSMGPEVEAGNGCTNMDDAIAVALEEVEEHGGEIYIYKCVAVKKVRQD